MSGHLSEGQVRFDENGQESTTPPLMCAPVSAPLPVSASVAPIARVEGGKFAPGRSANPGGRSKGLVAAVQKRAGRHGTKLVTGLWMLAFGKPQERADFFGEPVRVSAKDRLEALEQLLNRGWGRPAQAIDVTGGAPTMAIVVTGVPDEDRP